MGHIDLSGIGYHLPDGRVLLDDVSFRVGDGAKVALVGILLEVFTDPVRFP